MLPEVLTQVLLAAPVLKTDAVSLVSVQLATAAGTAGGTGAGAAVCPAGGAGPQDRRRQPCYQPTYPLSYTVAADKFASLMHCTGHHNHDRHSQALLI